MDILARRIEKIELDETLWLDDETIRIRRIDKRRWVVVLHDPVTGRGRRECPLLVANGADEAIKVVQTLRLGNE